MKLDNPKNAAVFWMQQFFGWVHLEKLVASLIDLRFISALLFFKQIQWCPDLVYPDLVDCRDLVD